MTFSVTNTHYSGFSPAGQKIIWPETILLLVDFIILLLLLNYFLENNSAFKLTQHHFAERSVSCNFYYLS